MSSANVREFTDANFDQEVLQAAEPVLVDFWAPWCGPCMKLGPTIDQIAQEYAGRVRVGKLNIDENMIKAGALGIRSIPTLMIFKGGKLHRQHVGLASKPDLGKLLDEALGAKV